MNTYSFLVVPLMLLSWVVPFCFVFFYWYKPIALELYLSTAHAWSTEEGYRDSIKQVIAKIIENLKSLTLPRKNNNWWNNNLNSKKKKKGKKITV